MNKRILLTLAILVTAGVVGFTIRPYAIPHDLSDITPPPITATTVDSTGSASVVVTEASLVVDGVSHHIPTGTTLYDAMKVLKASGDLTYEGKEYSSLGFFVESINGKNNVGDYYWILYVNGTSSSLGASATKIHPGDSIEWRYEKSY